jgi:AraC-like DNA-binding protein
MTVVASLRVAERMPQGRLASAVRRMWFLEGPPPNRIERILPLPAVHLIVNLAEPYRVLEEGSARPDLLLRGAFVSGVHTVPLVNENPALLRHVGAELHPHALRGLSLLEPRDVAERVQDAEPVFPGVDALRSRLLALEEADPDHVLSALESFLESRLLPQWAPDARVDAAIRLIEAEPDRTIGSVARELAVAHQTLIADFVRQVGLTPKRVAQVYRHHAFVSAIPPAPPMPTWTELAASAGYYDQPHFIRSFAALTGLTPRNYLARRRSVVEDHPSFLSEDAAGNR